MSFRDLPILPETLDVCKETCACQTKQSKKNAVTEKDKRLENWEKWTAKRRKLNQQLSESVNRVQCQTILNCSEKLHSIKEDQAVLEYTKIPNPHDRYRGNPSFWKLPVTLPNICDRRLPSEYFAAMTKEEKCEIPDIEYIKVPEHIMAEINVPCCGLKDSQKNWDALEYRKQRVHDLKSEIERIEPFKPDLNHLFVQGTGLGKTISPEQIGNVQLLFLMNEESTEKTAPPEYYVQFNDVIINDASTGTKKVYITFDYNFNSKNVATKYLTVTNATPLALRYHFKRCQANSLFQDIIPTVNPAKVFFFNLNEEIIMPQSKLDIPIWFKSSNAGVYKEIWEFCTRPCIWTNELMIILESNSVLEDLDDKCAEINQRLNDNIKNKIAEKTVSNLLSEIPGSNAQPIIYTYDRAMVFEAVNQTFSPFVRRPKYLYNKSVVDELEKFYATVKLPSHPDTWNYNIEDLRTTTKQRQRYDYEQKILLEIESVKTREKQAQEAKKAAVDDKVKSTETNKKGKKKLPDQKPDLTTGMKKDEGRDVPEVDIEAEEKYSGQLENLILKLEQPSVWINLEKNKYEWTYQILCSTVDKITQEMAQLNNKFHIKRTFKYPKFVAQTPDAFNKRTAVEYLEDIISPAPFRIFNDGKTDKPAPECLKDIPKEDALRRYKAYYGIQDDDQIGDKKKKKGKKGKEKKATKEKKAKTKGSKGDKQKVKDDRKIVKTRPMVELILNEAFDPDAKIDLLSTSESTTDEACVSKAISLSPVLLQDYNESAYLIVYTNLEKAVMRVADILENQHNKRIKSNVFKRILEYNKRIQPPIKCKVMDLKQVIDEAFDLTEITPSEPLEMITSKRRQPWISEVVQEKEGGSLWSIMQGPKQPEADDKPISYPEKQIIFKKKGLGKHVLKEACNRMSNAGIDPNWEDFKSIGTQAYYPYESNIEKKIYAEDMIDDILQSVFSLSCTDKWAHVFDSDLEESSDSSEDSFYDGDIPNVPNVPDA